MDKKSCEELAIHAYKQKMDTFINGFLQPPTAWELRQRHQEFAFECLDLFRTNASDTSSTWKLEASLKSLYATYMSENKLNRQMALLNHSLGESTLSSTTQVI
jgi:hypothetical protein